MPRTPLNVLGLRHSTAEYYDLFELFEASKVFKELAISGSTASLNVKPNLVIPTHI